jgi:adenosylmethionine-8-amino-7-oxononanoate aminotransferase
MVWAFDVDAVDPEWARKFALVAMRRELVLRPLGNTIYFIPPYVISESEIDFLVAKTFDCLEETIGKI